MKKQILTIISTLILGIGSLATAQDALKLATVNMQTLFEEFDKTQEAQLRVSEERAKLQKENNERLTRVNELEEKIGSLRKQIEDPSLNDTKKHELYKEFQEKFQELKALERERREWIGRRNAAIQERTVKEMRGIIQEIKTIVEEAAKTDGYDYVFDSSGLSASQVPFLLYSKDASDITPKLLKLINKGSSKSSDAGGNED